MSDSMNRHWTSRAFITALRLPARLVDTVRQLLTGWYTIPSASNWSTCSMSDWSWKSIASPAWRTPTSTPSARLSIGRVRSYWNPRSRPAGREPEIAGGHEHPALVGEHFVEAPEDRVAGHAHEQQAVLLVRDGAEPVRRLVLHLLDQPLEVLGALPGAAERVQHAEVDRAVHQGVEERRAGAG